MSHPLVCNAVHMIIVLVIAVLFLAHQSDYFNGRSLYYICFLILTGGEKETSANATVVISELSSPVLTSTTSLESSITVEWLAANCARSYNVSWQCTEPRSTGSNITTDTTITIPVDSNSKCTLSLVAVYGNGSTGPVTTAVVHPGYPRPTDNRCTSTSPDLILTCQFGEGELTDIEWNSSSGPINSSDNQLTLNYTTLRDGTTFQCSGVEMETMHRVRGKNYRYNNESLTCEPTIAPTPSGEEITAGPAAGAAGGVLVVLVAVGVVVVVAGVGVVVFRRRRFAVKVDCGDNEKSDQPTGSSQSEVHVNGVREGPAV